MSTSVVDHMEPAPTGITEVVARGGWTLDGQLAAEGPHKRMAL